MAYQIFYHPEVKKDLKGIDAFHTQLMQKSIEQKLATAPQDFGKPLRGSLKSIWSLRVADYRIIYKIQNNEVTILRIAHRKLVYEAGLIEIRQRKLI